MNHIFSYRALHCYREFHVSQLCLYVTNTITKLSQKVPPASLIHCIGNILSHSSGKWRDSLTMAALRFTNGCSEFHLCAIFIH